MNNMMARILLALLCFVAPAVASNAASIQLNPAHVRLHLKAVHGEMNDVQSSAFENVAQEFLSGLFERSVLSVYGIGAEVTGQTVLQHSGHDSTNIPVVPKETRMLYPLEVDLRVSGKLVATDEYTSADDVDFESTCRDYFRVNGEDAVDELNAAAAQAMQNAQINGEEDVFIDSGLAYFATVMEVVNVNPPTPTNTDILEGDNKETGESETSGATYSAGLVPVSLGMISFFATLLW